MSFENLDPHMMITAVEDALDIPLTGFASPLPSYINRVYEFQAEDDTRFIAKFYRPKRWSKKGILDEHKFVASCAEEDIPVVAPIILKNKLTLDEYNGIYFSVFPKRSGREMEIIEDSDWKRLGSVIGRIHMVGSREPADNRIVMTPETSTEMDIKFLYEGNIVTQCYKTEFDDVLKLVQELIFGLFDDIELIRIHGDCHRANILERPGEGLMVIDFDDMVMGPPVQDMWLLLPDHAEQSKREIELILDGYEQFREFDYKSMSLIEPLRLMRIIYFLTWCSRQVDDFKFQKNFPDWGSNSFWLREISDIRHQCQVVKAHIQNVKTTYFY